MTKFKLAVAGVALTALNVGIYADFKSGTEIIGGEPVNRTFFDKAYKTAAQGGSKAIGIPGETIVDIGFHAVGIAAGPGMILGILAAKPEPKFTEPPSLKIF